MVTATAFSDSPEEAKTMLKPLEDCPLLAQLPLAFVRHSARFRENVRFIGSALARRAAQSRGGHFLKYLAW